MKHRSAALALLALLSPTLGACHVYYMAHARVPLLAPLDSACMRNALDARSRPIHSRKFAEGRTSVVAYSTPAMFHSQWEVVAHVAQRDSSLHLGKVYRDSSAFLSATYVQLDRRIETEQGALTTADMARSLLDLRDACEGGSPVRERIFENSVWTTPYRAWSVRGTDSRVVMRLTNDSVRYRWHFPLNTGVHVLRVDTLAAGAEPRFPRWIQADSAVLTPPGENSVLATECWRGDTTSSGDLVALVREAETQYLLDVIESWALDRDAMRIRSVTTDGIQCHNSDRQPLLPGASRELRTAALTFRPLPGKARLYAALTSPDYPTEHAIARFAIDSQLVGHLDGGSFLMVELDPGRYRLTVPAWRAESVLLLNALSDSTYFVELRQMQFTWTWRASLRPMDPPAAMKRLRRAHMVSSSWPGTPMRREE